VREDRAAWARSSSLDRSISEPTKTKLPREHLGTQPARRILECALKDTDQDFEKPSAHPCTDEVARQLSCRRIDPKSEEGPSDSNTLLLT
jgi:hypothetical protein